MSPCRQEYEQAVTRLGVTVPELWDLDLAAIEDAFCERAPRSGSASHSSPGAPGPGAAPAASAGRP